MSTRKIRRTVGKRNPFLQRSPRIQHGRRDVGIVVDQALLECLQRLVHSRRLNVDLRRSAPDHHLAIGLGLELRNVVADLAGEVALVLADLLMLRRETLHPALVEGRRHRLDALQKVLHALDLIAVEHASRLGSVIQVAAEDIPARKHQVIELRNRRPILDQRRAIIGALSQPDRSHLRHRSKRLGKSSANCLYTGDERGRNRAHAGNHNSKFSCCWLDARCIRRRGVGCRHCDTYPSYTCKFQFP